MGSWGFGAYQNDDAVDWLVELERFFMKTIRGGSPEKKIAAIQTLMFLRIEPCFEDLKTCPLGFRLPGYELIDCVVESLFELFKKPNFLKDLSDEQIEMLKTFQEKFQHLKNQCLLMDKKELVRTSLIL